jgi:preprotein translocase subunit SecE
MATDVNTMEMKKETHTGFGKNTGGAPKQSPPAAQTTSPARAPAWTSFKLFDFIGNIKEEFHKISWTPADELRYYTKMVVGATFICGMGIYMIDLCIQNALHAIATVFHFIFG